MFIYLYVKQCSHCNLKYFGKTIQKNPETYKGSGIRWLNHIKKHKATPINLELYSFENTIDANIFALKYSEEHNIVESNEYANLKFEDALEGGFDHINKNEKATKHRLNSLRTKVCKEIILNCLFCKSNIKCTPSENRRFCSRSCSAKFHNSKRKKEANASCAWCKNLIKKEPNVLKKYKMHFCNKRCMGDYYMAPVVRT